MRLRLRKPAETVVTTQPEPSLPPPMESSDLAALYRAARVGGDYFEFIPVGNSRLIFVLLDIAGRRDQALGIAATAQKALRAAASEKFKDVDINEADAICDVVHNLNATILNAAGGVRCAAGFVGCYNESTGIISYINAGHVPALVRDGAIQVLEASGLPLGLFSHATHDPQVCALPEAGALLLASRGLLEVRAGNEEFGMDRLKESFADAPSANAKELCSSILRSVESFVEQNRRRRRFGIPLQSQDGDPLSENDITTVALIRAKAKSGAAAASR